MSVSQVALARRDTIVSRKIVSAEKLHPKFNDPEADIVLSSKEGILFRIHSIVLKSASGFFQSVISDINRGKRGMAQSTNEDSTSGNSCNESSSMVITLPFPNPPITRVLLMITAQVIPPWSSIAELEAAVEVMEYLETHGPLSIVRVSCLTSVCLSDPLRLYGLSSRLGWEDIMQHTAAFTLHLNLFPFTSSQMTSDECEASSKATSRSKPPDKDIERQLFRIPGPSLYRLLRLHRRRRDEFRAYILSPENFVGGTSALYECACRRSNDNGPWRILASRLFWEMDQDPSGSTILSPEMETWEESIRCWNSFCQGSSCRKANWNRVETLKKLRQCIEQLPKDL
ncbi:hypothetical protein AN958_11180 [Leucoagaricus sp. SymC.cos]|nr:hypothetical protein AN958_11180 [Leucoagaricus sp. SymC.cos]